MTSFFVGRTESFSDLTRKRLLAFHFM